MSVEVTRAYTTRFSEIYSTELGPGGTGPPMFKAFSSCFVRPDHLAVNETASDDSVPSLRTLADSRQPQATTQGRAARGDGCWPPGAAGAARVDRRARVAVRRGGPAPGERVDHVPWSRAIGASRWRCGLVTLRVEGHPCWALARSVCVFGDD